MLGDKQYRASSGAPIEIRLEADLLITRLALPVKSCHIPISINPAPDAYLPRRTMPGMDSMAHEETDEEPAA
ncbi:MAG: hypothetical protein U1F59_12065 [Candidatus Competibacteraceae bacterium]